MEAWKTIHRFIGKVLEKQSWNVIESEDYYRNIPFDNDLDIIYFICKKAKYISNYTFVPAYLAKMIYDDKLKYIPNNKNFILDFSNFTKYQNNDSINEFYDFIVPYIENNIIKYFFRFPHKSLNVFIHISTFCNVYMMISLCIIYKCRKSIVQMTMTFPLTDQSCLATNFLHSSDNKKG